MWYTLYIRNVFDEVIENQVYAENRWDLFGYIGYLYSTSLVGIKRIDYVQANEKIYIDKNKILSTDVKKKYLSN